MQHNNRGSAGVDSSNGLHAVLLVFYFSCCCSCAVPTLLLKLCEMTAQLLNVPEAVSKLLKLIRTSTNLDDTLIKLQKYLVLCGSNTNYSDRSLNNEYDNVAHCCTDLYCQSKCVTSVASVKNITHVVRKEVIFNDRYG